MDAHKRGEQRCRCGCHWDLSWLRFGDTKISPTDVDGFFMVERFHPENSSFLFFETKRTDEKLSRGQHACLERLSRQPNTAVFVLRGTNGNPSKLMLCDNGIWVPEIDCTRETVQRLVDSWLEAANRGGRSWKYTP